MKTIKRSTCALTGRTIRLVVHNEAYAVIVGSENYGFGFEPARAELAYDSIVHASRTHARSALLADLAGCADEKAVQP